LPDSNPVDYIVWGILQEKVFKILFTDLDELKQLLRMEWTKLAHVVIATVVHLWRRQQVQISDACLYTFSCNIPRIL